MSSPDSDRLPIFVLGMLQRTGTNHLWDLFGLHPDVEPLEPVFEDHLLQWSPHLFAYVEDVQRSWSDDWHVPAAEADALRRSIGDGIVSWVAGHSDRRVVTKMPSVEQAAHFFELFPSCPLVVIIRDGRNVVESMVTTFAMSYERAMRRWAAAADVVLDLKRIAPPDASFQVVRYEELADRPTDVMRRLCEVTALDPDAYPFDQVAALPVRGSSTLREDGGDVHWSPVDRTADFDPHSRWQSWGDHEHRRFARLAGEQQRALGYELVEVGGTDTVGERVTDTRDALYVQYRNAKLRGGRAWRNVRRVTGRI